MVEDKKLKEIEKQLEERLEDELERTLNWLKTIVSKRMKKQLKELTRIEQKELFEAYPLLNHTLIDLLKGEVEQKRYYDPQLEKMIDIGVNDPFSSIGKKVNRYKKEGIGPVIKK